MTQFNWHLSRRPKLPTARMLELLGLLVILLVAAGLRFANLSALGYVNHYYTAADISMLKSWHNFFYAAAEPGGAVSVDKPPVGLWIQALSVYLLGVNTLGVLLPEILAGLASVAVVYHLVRRSFGVPGGMFAALALALTPVVVATDRNNTMDSLLILTLLLAAWAFIKATETGKLGFLLLGACLVGVGFNIKMLEAFLPLPAFYVLYLLGAPEKFWRKLGKLALTSLLLAVVAFSWITIVDLTPADRRPYVGSSGDNSEMSLTIGYNGLNRLNGMLGRGVLGVGRASDGPSQGPMGRSGGPGQSPFNAGDVPTGSGGPPFGGGGAPGGGLQQGGFMNNSGRAFPGGSPGGAGGNANGMFDTGQPGLLRLFIPPLSKNASWLLPFGLVSLLLLILGNRLKWPLGEDHQSAVLWGGWLLTAGVFFSIAGFFHEYYLSVFAPPLAALVGLGASVLWNWYDRHPWLIGGLLAVASGATLALQAYTARSYAPLTDWLPYALGLLVIGLGTWLAAALRRSKSLARPGLICGLLAMLVAPAFWAGLTSLYPNQNQSLPGAYGGAATGPAQGVQVNQALLDYLEPRTQGVKYLMAVPSAMQGADYVIATGRPVLYLGGYMGSDQVLSVESLEQMIRAGELRFLYINVGENNMGGSNQVSSWIASNCKAVQGFEAQAGNSIPDGTGKANGTGSQFNGMSPGGSELQLSLYDCGK